MTDKEFKEFHGIDRHTACLIMMNTRATILRARRNPPAKLSNEDGGDPGAGWNFILRHARCKQSAVNWGMWMDGYKSSLTSNVARGVIDV